MSVMTDVPEQASPWDWAILTCRQAFGRVRGVFYNCGGDIALDVQVCMVLFGIGDSDVSG